ncbi:MAG: biuret amidohydrolase [Chloroflexota bacterium]|nr:biuret amidohydrolase [Chloroflexota bacterium]
MHIQPDLNRLALLVVDAQRDYLDPAGAFATNGWDAPTTAGVATLTDRLQRLVAAFRAAGRPVVFVRTALRPDAADCGFAGPWMARLRGAAGDTLVEGTWGVGLVDGLESLPTDYEIVKQGHGAFHLTNLDRLLMNLGVDQCVVAGVDTIGALHDTLGMGGALGYEQFLVEDAVWPLPTAEAPGPGTRGEGLATDELIGIVSAPAASGAGAVQTERERAALLIIDLQNDFVHPEGVKTQLGYAALSEEQRQEIIDNTNRLTTGMRARGWPVIFVNLTFRPDVLDTGLARAARRVRPIPAEAHYLERGTWGAEVTEGVTVEAPDILMEKKGNSGFPFTPLHRMLRNLGVQRCFISGGATSGCVAATVADGAALGYDFTVISDALYPPDSSYLSTLAERARVQSTATALAEIGSASVR